jgi:chromosome partitioning protein
MAQGQYDTTFRILVVVLGVPLFTAEIPRLKAFDRAFHAGVAVNQVKDDRAHRAWKAYASAGKEILHG